jgi:hypothetical protein
MLSSAVSNSCKSESTEEYEEDLSMSAGLIDTNIQGNEPKL